MSQSSILVGGLDGCDIRLELSMASRHGLIAGATGTGKTVTLQTLIEGFSSAGIPVFATDVKGDLSGLAKAGTSNPRILERVELLELDNYQPRPFPVIFWDLLGKRGHPVRTTISDMGPVLLTNLLGLNETQSSVLYVCFKIADDQGLLLLDLKDLRSLLAWIAENAKELQPTYGSVAPASLAAIQRALVMLEGLGGEAFFAEPALQLSDLMQVDFSGNGVVSILDSVTAITHPQLYSSFLLWLLSELYEQLPEQMDDDRPSLVLFFDEAHLIFNNAPKGLLEKIENVVRLIRSKGVGIYFITQLPSDIPSNIAGQLGNRIQHALRAFTPKDQKAVQVAAQTFRSNGNLDTEQAISQLGMGEALVSVLDRNAEPTPVEQVLIAPPCSQIGPITDSERAEHLNRSPMKSRYSEVVDRESAYEVLKQRAHQEQETVTKKKTKVVVSKDDGKKSSQGLLGSLAKEAARSVGQQLGRQIVRGILGSLMGKRR